MLFNFVYKQSLKKKPDVEETLRWLKFLAKQLKRESKTDLLIEKLQPSWLDTRPQKWLYRLGIVLIFALVFYVTFDLTKWLNFGLVSGIVLGFIFGLSTQVKLFETFKIQNPSRQELQQILIISVTVFITSLLTHGILSWIEEQISSLASILKYINWLQWLLNLLYVLQNIYFVGAIWLFSRVIRILTSSNDVEPRIFPNQGILNSAVNAGIFALTVGLISGLLSGLISGLISGLLFGLVLGISSIQHFILRLILYHNGDIPWNYARFLNYATERRLLQRIGGRYRFIHDSLREHFAHL